MNNDQYVSTKNNRHTGEVERQWIEYADGVFEPVRKNGNLSRKYHGDKRTLDWWSVDKPLDWTPAAEGKQVSLNHDYGQKESSKAPKAAPGKAAAGDQARKAPPKPGTPGKSTISLGAAGLWEHEARERAEAGKRERENVNSHELDDLGISWGGTNRSLLDGPKYGNSGGKNYTGGPTGKKQPIDTSDRMYKQHDLGWANCDQLPKSQQGICREQYDADLVKKLEGLSDDANEWPHSPPRSLKNDAEKFRKGAIFWFKR